MIFSLARYVTQVVIDFLRDIVDFSLENEDDLALAKNWLFIPVALLL